MSYSIDVYRNDSPVQKNIINLGTFITLFPQLVAGPIVRYHDISHQLINRCISFDKIYEGRIVVGVSQIDKKPELAFDIYRQWLRDNDRNLPIFPVDMRKKNDVLLLVESIIVALEQE